MKVYRRVGYRGKKILYDILSGIALSVIVLAFGCTGKNESTTEESTRFKQYFRQGEQLYLQHCSNCHQANGKGLGRLYPPIAKSDFMQTNFEEVICLIRNGIKRDLLVNGAQYNQDMPAIPTLTDLEIAEIATYIYNSWEHKKGLIAVRDVTAIHQKCPAEK